MTDDLKDLFVSAGLRGIPVMNQPCGELLPGHKHCRHGHVSDCPNAGGCDWLEVRDRQSAGNAVPPVISYLGTVLGG